MAEAPSAHPFERVKQVTRGWCAGLALGPREAMTSIFRRGGALDNHKRAYHKYTYEDFDRIRS
jgi:hypothetical protein